MLMAGQHLYEFGTFRLDASERQLSRQDQIVSLTPKAVEALIYLVERRGHTVGKDELIQAIWPETFVEDGSLTQVIWMLRKTLGDTAEGQEIIATIPKRGYRFVAEVREVVPEAEREPPAVLPAAGSARRSRSIFVALSAIGILSAVVLVGLRQFSMLRAKANRRVMLAVLPVQNLSGDAGREYISDGLTEELISQLGNTNPARMGVIARTSSMAYKGTAQRVDQIAKELGVDYVLEASLRQSGDRLRITAQLIRASDQTHLWARDYDRAAGDVVALQNEVAQAVAQQIQVSLIPEEQMRRAAAAPVTPEAYDAYLKGRFFWNKRTPEDMNTAAAFFRQAIHSDPKYAHGYVGLADTYLFQVLWDQLSPSEGVPLARAAAEKSLELDDRLAEAHTTLASIKDEFDWDWRGSEAEYQRALELNPNYATAHHWYAELLAEMGRFEEATAEIKKAQLTDPLSAVIATTLGEMNCRRGHCDKAVEQYGGVLRMYPGFPQAQYLLAEAYARMGMYEKAVAEIDRAEQGAHLGPGWRSVTLAYAAGMSGRSQEALNLIEQIKKETGPQHVDYYLAIVYGALGDKDQAFARLEGALRVRGSDLPSVQADYRLDGLKSDPRYKDLLRRMSFPL
jgi:TolB-like protein/DNA-binding winged helix-turn-helix (wHTH) protein/Tfp pilus assembly protein PilF